MYLSKDQLDEVTELAALQFPVEEVAIILEVNPRIFAEAVLNDADHPAYKAYHKGHLLAVATARKAVATMAKHGSTPALKMLIDQIETCQRHNQLSKDQIDEFIQDK